MVEENLETSGVPALIEGKTLIEAFKPNGLDVLIEKIRVEASGFAGDISTEAGRKEIASFAYKIAKAKTQIEKLGKESIEELQKTVKAVTAERQRGVAELQKLQDAVRKPLTDFEEAEKSRIAAHEAAIARLELVAIEAEREWASSIDVAAMELRLDTIERERFIWEEFNHRGTLAHTTAIKGIREAIERRKKYDAEQEELVRLRSEAAAREQKKREERIALEAAECARKDAEKKAASAVQAERDRQEAARNAEADAVAKREADTNHRTTINRAILAGLLASGITEEQAKTVIKAILSGTVPHVKIIY